jgi:hypothetical protein
MEAITYNIVPQNSNDDSFYIILGNFTTQFLEHNTTVVSDTISTFVLSQQINNKTAIKSYPEYFLELLTIGLYINNYSRYALSTSRLSNRILIWLYKNRNKYKPLKQSVDKLRGLLMGLFLTSKAGTQKVKNIDDFDKLIDWLRATGEFTEEVKQIMMWRNFLNCLSDNRIRVFIDSATELAQSFEKQARLALGEYTENIPNFLKNKLDERKYHENYIFCGRTESEYHLNMFGAEILNRQLRNTFKQTRQKVILLPTCMRNPKNKCEAEIIGYRMRCKACSSYCNINKIQNNFAHQGFEVAIIPHSSGFTKFLEFWKNQEHTGLIGVACVLNLLKGGYEMKNLNIPAQCVFLDYCGCKKHWHKQGLPTNINLFQLQKILANG